MDTPHVPVAKEPAQNEWRRSIFVSLEAWKALSDREETLQASTRLLIHLK